jgi:ribonuclease VapC
MMQTTVLDSYALIAFFEDEPGADDVHKLLLAAEKGKARLLMSVVNLGEVWYAIARAVDAATADRYTSEIRGMAIEVMDAGWELTRRAALFKAKGGLAYADCFAAALACKYGAALMTGDHEFERLKGEIEIQWMG